MTLAILAALMLQDPPKTGGPFEVALGKPSTRYWLQVPSDYDAARRYPLAIVLHGAGSSAESFIQAWPAAVTKYGWILLAVKSRGQAWEDADGELILGCMDDVMKTYSIDKDRVFLIGYSSGGFMASRFGLKHHARFRATAVVAGAQEASARGAKEHMAFIVCCGERDPNLSTCKRVFKFFEKQGFDAEFKEVPKMEHSPILPEAIAWVLDRVSARDLSLASVTARTKLAEREKRWIDAIAQWRALLADDAAKAKAEKELFRLEKLGEDRLADAEKMMASQRAAALQRLAEVAKQFAGFDCAKRAEALLKDANE
jgi:pimeloyl-ACP methyl ester carboxylesterase